MTEPTKREIARGMTLLRLAHEEEEWGGPVAVVPVDDVCKWNQGEGACRRPIQNVVVLLSKDKTVAHVVALCEHHTKCMEAAVHVWREQN